MKQLELENPLLSIDSTGTARASGVFPNDTSSLVLENKPSDWENHLSIPCTIRYPKQPVIKGIIQQDNGDCFTIYIPDNDSTVTVPKLLVYPDFSSVRQINKNPPTKQVTPPSKTRRKKGEGTGYIYRRTITRGGKQYEEFYYRYRDESGKLKAKYIPQRLLCKVEETESAKKPIADILFLLGGDEISRGEQFSICEAVSLRTSNNICVQSESESDELIAVSRGEQPTPPSTRKRKQGEGTGYIECKPITRNGKQYKQYWYHYEFWENGRCVTKKSKYIPKRLVAKIDLMNNDRVSVYQILEVLNNKK